jgi:anti-sigma regulatory factor (Ser/Thr protein kinase)
VSGSTSSDLVHQVFVYRSTEQFVASMAPFVRDGLARGDVVFAATKRSNVDALREELGADSELVELHDAFEWQTRPYNRLQAFRRLVDGLPPGACLRAMGEPVWAGSSAEIRQWARYESLINLALADAPMRFVCLYDGSELSQRIIDYALRTHPEQICDGRDVDSPSFESPHEFTPGAPAEPSDTALELPLDPAPFRRLVAERALAFGIDGDRVDDFVLATHEVAANALRHGRPPFRAYLWAERDEIVCQVVDSGRGIPDPLTGWMAPARSAIGGWGLPIARQLCEVVEVSRRGSETVVSVHAARNGGKRVAS